MVSELEVKASRNAFMSNDDYHVRGSRALRLHMTLWSLFFALAVVGGLS
jgi:hypothetical protein